MQANCTRLMAASRAEHLGFELEAMDGVYGPRTPTATQKMAAIRTEALLIPAAAEPVRVNN